jgi:serine/threonine protein kinase/Flp pilus assembly protein TadD
MSTHPGATPILCPGPETLAKLLRDELPPESAGRLEGHVGTCPGCQRMLERLIGSVPGTLAPLAGPQARAADEEPPDLPGYETVGRIDAGGMGVVWHVRDLQFGRPLAVKVMKACAAPALVERFEGEARVCGQLTHPSIVPVHAMGRLADGRPYYAMKLVEGRTLEALLEEAPVPAERRGEFVRVFGQVCQAVAYAHARGVIHRDLKPANVMVGAHGEVQLMDWGLAKVLEAPRPGEAAAVADTGCGETTRTRAGSVLGTVAYMAPEQARGLGAEVDRRSDVFGLGAILCQVLTGEPPYVGPDADAVRLRATEADLGETLARLRGCGADPELVRLAERCLAPRKADRPADAGEVAAALAAYLVGVQERLEGERCRALAVEEGRRRKLWLGLAAAVLAAVGLAAGGWLYWQGQRAQRHQDAAQALEQAEGRLRGGDFAAAKESLARAKDRLGGDGPAELADRHQRLQAAWQLVGDLEEIQRKRTTPTGEGLFDHQTAQTSYVRTFADAGYDLTGGDPQGLAENISRSPVKGPILAAIDTWALVCAHDMRFVPNRKEEYRRRRDRLLEVARAVDPDPEFRDKIRNPRVWDERRQLEELAERATRTDLSPRLAALLAELLRRAEGDPEPLLRRTQSRYPDDFWLNYDLARWLDVRRPAEALRYYQAALAVRPHHAMLQSQMAANLGARRYWDEAIAGFREVLAGMPEDATGSFGLRNNLAVVLADKGDIEGALALFRVNERVRPNQVRTHVHLGQCLKQLGRFTEALESFRRAQQLATEQGSFYRPQAERMAREGERLVGLDRRLESGQPNPAGAEEALGFADVCFCKKRYADAVGFYRRAFEREPKLAADVDAGDRYRAACAAALAAAGRGEGGTPLDAPRRAELRKQALTWLREDLDAWARRADDPKFRPTVEAEMRLWERHPHLASLRDPAASQTPDPEQQSRKQFWADVNMLLRKAQSL